jgi:L-2,4-diaminobutyrate decarboxylase
MNVTESVAQALQALQPFLDQSRAAEGPVVVQPPMAALAQQLDLRRWLEQGGLEQGGLAAFMQRYLAASTRLHHPGYMGHQVAVPLPLGAVAALVDAASNNAMAIYEMGPAAATVEAAVIEWMLGKVGWQGAPLPGEAAKIAPLEGFAGGVLTHGGSLANLTAFAAARAQAAPEAWQSGTPADLVIIAPPACHYSVSRAACLLGVGQAALVAAPVDQDGRFAPQRLAAQVEALEGAGKRVMAVVANAGATAAGLYDPLAPIAEVCRARGLWLHVDGAHGASALASPRDRGLLAGVEGADSLTWDCHKMLRTPTLVAAVLVRRLSTLEGAFRDEASYLFHDKDEPGLDLIHRTVECTKAGLGLKAFFTLASQGEQGVAAYVEGQTDLARAAAALLRRRPGWAVAIEPETNVLCFRWENADDAAQLAARTRLLQAGRWYISSTEFRGQRWLRLALMNPATRLEDIAALVTQLESLFQPQLVEA